MSNLISLPRIRPAGELFKDHWIADWDGIGRERQALITVLLVVTHIHE